MGRLWAFDDHTAGRKLTDATVKYNYTETNWIHNDKEAGGHMAQSHERAGAGVYPKSAGRGRR